jgi:hypothetical protein
VHFRIFVADALPIVAIIRIVVRDVRIFVAYDLPVVARDPPVAPHDLAVVVHDLTFVALDVITVLRRGELGETDLANFPGDSLLAE